MITQAQIEQMATVFAKTWQRPPTPLELTGLVQDRVREEIYYREAMALGLDKDDTVIRSCLRQKIEFVSEDNAGQAERSDAELEAWLKANPEKFRVEPGFTFEQAYLNPEKHGDHVACDAACLLDELNAGGGKDDPSGLGDAFLLGNRFVGAPMDDVAKQFGDSFAAKLAGLALGKWQGPIESDYGFHFVLLTERAEGRTPTLADVRDAVRRKLTNARRLEANDKYFQNLLKRYTLSIEGTAGLENPGKSVK